MIWGATGALVELDGEELTVRFIQTDLTHFNSHTRASSELLVKHLGSPQTGLKTTNGINSMEPHNGWFALHVAYNGGNLTTREELSDNLQIHMVDLATGWVIRSQFYDWFASYGGIDSDDELSSKSSGTLGVTHGSLNANNSGTAINEGNPLTIASTVVTTLRNNTGATIANPDAIWPSDAEMLPSSRKSHTSF